MIEYLNRETVMKELDRNSITKKITLSDGVSIYDSIQKLPTADVVDAKTVEQLKWERDMAIKQLESYGVGFCEKADVIKVKHGAWIKPTEASESICSECRRTPKMVFDILPDYCPHCGTKMDGERRCE